MLKKILLFMLGLLLGVSAFASEFESRVESQLVASEALILRSNLGNTSHLSKVEIENKMNEFSENPFVFKDNSEDLNCKVAVHGEVDLVVGKASVDIEVSGPCDEIIKNGKKIAEKLLDDVLDALKMAF